MHEMDRRGGALLVVTPADYPGMAFMGASVSFVLMQLCSMQSKDLLHEEPKFHVFHPSYDVQ